MLVSVRMDKKVVAYIHNEVSLSHEKGGYPLALVTTWMDLEHFTLRYVRQRQKNTV